MLIYNHQQRTKKARQTSKPNRAPIKKKKGNPIITGAKVKSNGKERAYEKNRE
nr:MAG TPA: hypothetical protein [Caudoviricetes sp.]